MCRRRRLHYIEWSSSLPTDSGFYRVIRLLFVSIIHHLIFISEKDESGVNSMEKNIFLGV